MTMQANFEIRSLSTGVVRLQEAVLIYRGGQNTALATVHDIGQIDGTPVILAGKPILPHAAIQLARDLSHNVWHGGFLPETVLYLDGDLLMWWVPPHRRHLAFHTPQVCKGGKKERGAVVPHPGLVFAASSRMWSVWAVKGAKRPTPDTPLYQAPYFNVWEGGKICKGNVDIPDGATAEKIEAWHAAFFQSYFTHPNVSNKLVKYEGGSVAFWRDMLDGKFLRFPQKVLVSLETTLQDVLTVQEPPHA
jgi:PRTRC genetic system protein B